MASRSQFDFFPSYFRDGLQQAFIESTFEAYADEGGSSYQIGIDLDNTLATSTNVFQVGGRAESNVLVANEFFKPQLGLHFTQAMESGLGGGATVYNVPNFIYTKLDM